MHRLYFVIGASGVGKMTATKALEKRRPDFIFCHFDPISTPPVEEILKKSVSGEEWQRQMKENLDCGQVDKPIPVMIVNGTADPINPFRGGMVNLGSAKLGNVLSSEDTAKYWAKLLGVTGPPQIATLSHKGGRSSVDSMTWVKDSTPVVILYVVENGGHAMPKAGTWIRPS